MNCFICDNSYEEFIINLECNKKDVCIFCVYEWCYKNKSCIFCDKKYNSSQLKNLKIQRFNYKELKTKNIKFIKQNINLDQINKLLLFFYQNFSFSTIGYYYNMTSKQQIKKHFSGNCIAMSNGLQYLLQKNNIKSYLIPATVPNIYKRKDLLQICHVALLIPINEYTFYIIDPSFYFLEPIIINLKNNQKCNKIKSKDVYQDVIDDVEYHLKFPQSYLLNSYQNINNSFACKCYFSNNKRYLVLFY